MKKTSVMLGLDRKTFYVASIALALPCQGCRIGNTMSSLVVRIFMAARSILNFGASFLPASVECYPGI